MGKGMRPNPQKQQKMRLEKFEKNLKESWEENSLRMFYMGQKACTDILKETYLPSLQNATTIEEYKDAVDKIFAFLSTKNNLTPDEFMAGNHPEIESEK